MRADQPVGERGCHGAWRSGRSVGFDPRSIDRDLLTSSSTFRSSGGFWTPRLTTKRLLSRHLERCRSWKISQGNRIGHLLQLRFGVGLKPGRKTGDQAAREIGTTTEEPGEQPLVSPFLVSRYLNPTDPVPKMGPDSTVRLYIRSEVRRDRLQVDLRVYLP